MRKPITILQLCRTMYVACRQKLLAIVNPTYRKICASALFDNNYYMVNNPDISFLKWDPLQHYMQKGYLENRRPSIFFDSFYYTHTYLKASQKSINPLLHFIEKGWKEGKNPNPFFETSYYLKQIESSQIEDTDPLSHYLMGGWKRGVTPSRFLVSQDDENIYAESEKKRITPLEKVLLQEDNKKHSIPEYFDPDYYHDQLPGSSPDSQALWKHYLEYGLFEAKSPVPLFDPVFYGAQLSNGALHEIDLYEHYRQQEKSASPQKPAEWFDPRYYHDQAGDDISENESVLEHYLRQGVYRKAYTDLRVAQLMIKPVISIIVPVYNAQSRHLNNCIRSVLYQAYPHWELCLCDDASTSETVREILLQWSARDPRIKVCYHEENGGISKATNSAAALATGEFLGFLDNDDELTVDCLFWVAKAIGESGAQFIYTDEDLIGEDNRRFTPFYKPGFNLELLLNHNYITHFVAVSRKLFVSVGGCDPHLDGAQDYDIALKCSEAAQSIVHIPRVLYHWRASTTSTSIDHSQKSYADEAGRFAVESSLKRRNVSGKAEFTSWKYFYKPTKYLNNSSSVTVILDNSLDCQGLEKYLQALVANTDYPEYSIILSSAPESQINMDLLPRSLQQCIHIADQCTMSQNSRFSRMNEAVRSATGEYLVFVSTDIMPNNKDWLNCLLEDGQSEEVGLCTGRLIPRSGTEVISTAPDTTSQSVFHYLMFLQLCSVHMNGLNCSQEVTAVPSELCCISRALFQETGGFNAKDFPHMMAGVDLAYRLLDKGYTHIYAPWCAANWNVRRTERRLQRSSLQLTAEKSTFQNNHHARLAKGDPFYNPGCYLEKGMSEAEFSRWYVGADFAAETSQAYRLTRRASGTDH